MKILQIKPITILGKVNDTLSLTNPITTSKEDGTSTTNIEAVVYAKDVPTAVPAGPMQPPNPMQQQQNGLQSEGTKRKIVLVNLKSVAYDAVLAEVVKLLGIELAV